MERWTGFEAEATSRAREILDSGPYTEEIIVALLQRIGTLETALRDMVRWFATYPEFIPNPERMDEVVETINRARATLAGRGGENMNTEQQLRDALQIVMQALGPSAATHADAGCQEEIETALEACRAVGIRYITGWLPVEQEATR